MLRAVFLCLPERPRRERPSLRSSWRERFGAEIVGADSRQIYRGMPIGTAAPTRGAATRRSPHHLDRVFSIRTNGIRRRATRATRARAIEAIHARGQRAIVAGGTGFYLRALAGDVALAPQYDEALRDRLAREARAHPPEVLWQWLAARSACARGALDPNDSYRVLRALEVALAGAGARAQRRVGGVRCACGRHSVREARARRADCNASTNGSNAAPTRCSPGDCSTRPSASGGGVAANAVGYPQALAFLRGWSTQDELRASLVRATRRYARRQRSWFRAEPGVTWVSPALVEAVAREKLGWS